MRAARFATNLLAFQVAWCAGVLGAAHGRPWAGPLAAAAALLLHLALTPRLARAAEVRLALLAPFLGALLDGLLARLGYIAFAGAGPGGYAPAWMLALWVAFATTLNVSLGWLDGRLWLAALVGALAGPAAYAGGVALGAAAWPAGAVRGLFGVALVWAWALPALVFSAGWRRPAAPARAASAPAACGRSGTAA